MLPGLSVTQYPSDSDVMTPRWSQCKHTLMGRTQLEHNWLASVKGHCIIWYLGCIQKMVWMKFTSLLSYITMDLLEDINIRKHTNCFFSYGILVTYYHLFTNNIFCFIMPKFNWHGHFVKNFIIVHSFYDLRNPIIIEKVIKH